jgi:hypothetical protein
MSAAACDLQAEVRKEEAMAKESPNYDDRDVSRQGPAESHNRTTDRGSENPHGDTSTACDQIVSDTRSQIDSTVPGILKK